MHSRVFRRLPVSGTNGRLLMKISTEHQSSRSKGDRILSLGREGGKYSVRLARGEHDVRAAQTLRFMVFNLEMNEGLEDSYKTFLDADQFDNICDHLLVEDSQSGEVVGTYRLQTGKAARSNLGFYSQQEFDFSAFSDIEESIVELGRACVRKEHRNLTVLGLLWQGIVKYAQARGCRYLIGCSSISSQDIAEGMRLFELLSKDHLVSEPFQTSPNPGFECLGDASSGTTLKLPKLLSAYLAVGAKICGKPAIDREFKTIDFLTFMDLENLNIEVARRLGLKV